MAAIIKTIEAWRDPARVLTWLTRRNASPQPEDYLYYFALGRGRPKQAVEQLWFTFQGCVLGWFAVAEIVPHLGEWADFVAGGTTMEEATQPKPAITLYLDRLGKMWRPKPGVWLILCPPPFHLLEEKIFFSGFQGFRYFEFESYRKGLDAKIPV